MDDVKRDKYLKKKYGISLKQYNHKLKQQNYCCAVCGKHQDNFKRSLHVDHNHKSTKVRGLLCYYCNRRFVGRHTLETATKLYNYLRRFE